MSLEAKAKAKAQGPQAKAKAKAQAKGQGPNLVSLEAKAKAQGPSLYKEAKAQALGPQGKSQDLSLEPPESSSTPSLKGQGSSLYSKSPSGSRPLGSHLSPLFCIH